VPRGRLGPFAVAVLRPTWISPGQVVDPAWPCTGRGLPWRAASPRRRCALAAPFHLCLYAAHV